VKRKAGGVKRDPEFRGGAGLEGITVTAVNTVKSLELNSVKFCCLSRHHVFLIALCGLSQEKSVARARIFGEGFDQSPSCSLRVSRTMCSSTSGDQRVGSP